jgi:hypothetical protein
VREDLQIIAALLDSHHQHPLVNLPLYHCSIEVSKISKTINVRLFCKFIRRSNKNEHTRKGTRYLHDRQNRTESY